VQQGKGLKQDGVSLQREVAQRSCQLSPLSISRVVALRQARVHRPSPLLPFLTKELLSEGHWRVARFETLAQQGWNLLSHEWILRPCLVPAAVPGYAALSSPQVHSRRSHPPWNPVRGPECCRGRLPGSHHERVSRPAPQTKVRGTAPRAPREKARRTGTGSSLSR